MNCSATATTDAAIVYSNTSTHPVIDEGNALRLRIGDNYAPSAQITVVVVYALGA